MNFLWVIFTLGMIDVVFAQAISHRMGQKVSACELTSIAVLLVGGVLLLWLKAELYAVAGIFPRTSSV